MQHTLSTEIECKSIMNWLPNEVQTYLKHTEEGESIRAIARRMGVHASTVLRQVRKTEARRDDPLVDSLLSRLGDEMRDSSEQDIAFSFGAANEDPMTPHLVRVLRALLSPDTNLVVGAGVETAVVLRSATDGEPVALAKAPVSVVELMALLDWIKGGTIGRVARYQITQSGRQALNKLLAHQETRATGFAESQAGFLAATSHQENVGVQMARASTRGHRKVRAVGAETPVRVLARRRGRDKPYLGEDLVSAAERLNRDFALGQFEHSEMQGNWASWMREGAASASVDPSKNRSDRKLDARRRFAEAIKAIGPELAELAVAVCCHEKGMECVEREMSMPARSGKYMLRIALKYLARHYGEQPGQDHELIY
ncbi:Helix-turn-helix domain-containing protein [Aliiroseovarius halocynthiae]|uniref:Helix-turn-helix domain-containing protein n=1 Tax=Aliiroseovarius halocynthiae TaxID=985055 RepID=A0A545SVX8_9RHOB|nr:DUF6456 domain-containing protein [Aliiroseovarius halocynthiae]TQV69120.1 helix-turn-helix domain-containing protein [Aliiroseovarius halocynthiae]SMR71877.1 Helix-turn-helix domain-containing protein [Aliiroseovarius halocynthiae]